MILSEPTIAVVIPAGGGGTRLWPRSRQATPKQFLDVVSERTIDSHVRNLRAKFDAVGGRDLVETRPGIGYRIGSCGA